MQFKYRHQSKALYAYMSQTLFWMMSNHFRHIYPNNITGVPSDAPVLLATNHPTAFLDPVLMGHLIHPPIYNMTRGDMFQKTAIRRFFESLNMFPVYRSKDGFVDRDRNDQVFEFCVQKMSEHRIVNLFVEGMHHADKRLGPIQKGIMRIAFPAYERFELEQLQIIPIGLSYWYSDRPRDTAFVNVGQPIFIRDYWEEYQSKPAAAMLRINKDLIEALRSLCYHIEDPADDDLAELLLTLHRNEQAEIAPFPVKRFNTTVFKKEKEVLDQLNEMDATEKTSLRARVTDYFQELEQHGIQDDALNRPQWTGFNRAFLLIFGAIPGFIGYVFRLPIILLTSWFVQTKIKKREFISSIYIGLEHYSSIVWYAIILLACIFSFKLFWVSLALMLPLLGWFSMVYIETLREFTTAWKARFHPQRSALQAARKNLRNP